MHKNSSVHTGYRIIFGLLGFSSLVTEIAVLSERGKFIPANFFSFFTTESNLIAATVLILSSLTFAKGSRTKWLAMLRGASTLNMVLVGILFSVLLSGLKNAEFTAVPWDNSVLHYIMPIVVALDWLIDIPQVRVAFKQSLLWLIFPGAYLIYSLIRGHYVGWYPYPFLNPATSGYGHIALLSLVLILATVGLAWLLAASTTKKRSANA